MFTHQTLPNTDRLEKRKRKILWICHSGPFQVTLFVSQPALTSPLSSFLDDVMHFRVATFPEKKNTRTVISTRLGFNHLQFTHTLT